MIRRLPRLSPLLLVLPLAACPNPFAGTACTTEARPAISVEVLDASTGASAAAGATLIARDGAFADTVVVPDHPGIRSVGVAHERPGVYTVLVRKEGYYEWSREGVRVRDAECHVRTVELEARLEPFTRP